MKCLDIVLLLIVLLVPEVPVSAQEITVQPSLKIPTMVFAAAAAGDWASTYHGVSHLQFFEGDPLINRWQNHPALMVAAGTALDVGSVMIWNRYVGRRHPKLAALGLYVAASFRTYLCLKGIRIIEGADVTSPAWNRR